MKPGILVGLSLAVALAVSGCATGAPATTSSTQPTAAASTVASTTVLATATAIPASPTVGPTIAPTIAPTVAPTIAPTAVPTNPAAAHAAPSGPAASAGDLAPTAAAMAAAKSYRVTITTTNAPSGQPATVVLEVVKPDRLHTKFNLADGKTIEVISIGSDTYVKAGGTTWVKSPMANPATAALLSNDPQKLLAQMNSGQKYGTLTKGTVEQVGGTACQNWLWTPAAPAASQSAGTLCIAVQSHLPVQFKTSDGKTVVKYSDWNGPISIEPPI